MDDARELTLPLARAAEGAMSDVAVLTEEDDALDVVDELARTLGVEVEADEEFHTTAEILSERDRLRWRLDEAAADAEEGRPPRARRRRIP